MIREIQLLKFFENVYAFRTLRLVMSMFRFFVIENNSFLALVT
jgi:hypothetical protein